VYTHSIPWALHGKDAARKGKTYSLLGNRLDLWMRETQDKQTGGIPIGPDTSFIVGEVIGTAIDLELSKRIPRIKGTRSIDDYFLYFDLLSEAENAIAVLHGITREFELELNDPKTEILPTPDSLEPRWKGDLRNFAIRATGPPQAADLLTFFDRAFLYARDFPSDSVLTYAAKRLLGAEIKADNWKLCEALLLKAALGEPGMLSTVAEIYEHYEDFHSENAALAGALHSICWYHSPLQHGNEVAWALWIAKKFEIEIPEQVGNRIINVDDDVVALIGMDLWASGMLKASAPDLWYSHMNKQNLYDSHWLLAYEADTHGWVPYSANRGYAAADDFFSILQTFGVQFYGADTVATSSDYVY
jgi:hypothetical protein